MTIPDLISPAGPRTAVLVAAILAAIGTTAVTSTAFADEPATESSEQPQAFNGAFWELSARGGAVLPSEGSTGWAADVGFRNSFPMYAGDNRIAYQYQRRSLGGRTVQIHGGQATVGLHPFFLALLSEGWLSHFLASLHLELGIGPQWARLEANSQDASNAEDTLGLAGSVGTGFDLPLTDANQGRALWVSAVYRRSWSTNDFDIDGAQSSLHDHQIFVGLAWRSNGMLW